MEDDLSTVQLNRRQKKYKFTELIGCGSFGLVYKARNRVSGEIVAIKIVCVTDDREGVPSSLIREVSLLKEMDHDNIIRLLEIWNIEKTMFLVFEYLDFDLFNYMKTYPLDAKDPQRIKKFLLQILSGVAYCHSQKIIHRDLKPANLLIDTGKDIVKIADFGLARPIGVPHKAYTNKVATTGYKAPELLLDSRQYSTPVDVWSVGCIFAEMVTHQNMFHGLEVNQLSKMFSIMSTPDKESRPGVTSLLPKDLAKEVPGLEPTGVDLLSKMLCLNPSKRITAQDALNHAYFRDVKNVS